MTFLETWSAKERQLQSYKVRTAEALLVHSFHLSEMQLFDCNLGIVGSKQDVCWHCRPQPQRIFNVHIADLGCELHSRHSNTQ